MTSSKKPKRRVDDKDLQNTLRATLEEALVKARKEGADRLMTAILSGKVKLPPLDKTIFVNVAAYCEPHLELTLDSLFSNAMLPQNLRVGLFDQSDQDNIGWLRKKPYWDKIRYLNADHRQSRGASWARNIASSLYAGEDFYFQIDSHTIFDPGWDRTLLDGYALVSKKVDKPIITTYPIPFKIEDGKPVWSTQRIGSVYMMGLLPTASFDKKGINYGAKVYYENGPSFKEGFHIAGGFIFTSGSFVDEVPYDPQLYFEGEEQNLAVRAFTHGWSIMHPSDKYIPLYHLYKTNESGQDSHHWNSEHDKQRDVKWVERHKHAEKRLEDLLFHGKHLGAYGLGRVRTLRDFAELSGIDFQNKTIYPKAYAEELKTETEG